MYSVISKIVLIIFLALTISVGARATEKRLTVSKGDKLSVNVNYGEIIITTWEKNELLIKSDDDENGIEIKQSGNYVSVNGGSEGSDILISAPSNFNIEAKTNAGSVTIKGNISGKISLYTSGGDIKTENIYGWLDANTGGGNISIGTVKGSAKINSGGGDMNVGDVDGDLKLNTGGGNVKAGRITKSLKLNTGGGNIAVTEIGKDAGINTGGGNILVDKSGGKIDMTTGGGDIKLNSSKDEIKAKTGSGSVMIQNASGRMNIYSGSGDIDIYFTSGYKGNSEFTTNNGNVALSYLSNIKATITVKVNGWDNSEESSIENIQSDYKASSIVKHGKDNYETAVYQINGGGNNINVTVTNGNVVLKKNK
jgi:hypothetical protein